MGFWIFIGLCFVAYWIYEYFQEDHTPPSNTYKSSTYTPTYRPTYSTPKKTKQGGYWGFEPKDLTRIPDGDEKISKINSLVKAGNTIRLRYKDSKGDISNREITPKKIQEWGGHYYLKAYCHRNCEDRTFKIDRIISINGEEIKKKRKVVQVEPEYVSEFEGKKILMVENDSTLAKECQSRLRKSKASSKVVTDGISALKALTDNHYDFVYINSNIPFVSGIEILRNIKRRNLTDSPVVFFSNKQDDKLKSEVQRLGAAGYYVQTKADADEVISAIEPFVSNEN